MSGLEGLLAGRVLGDRYRIEEVIGRGGMGAVYRATDERLGRQVAVKVVTVSGGDDQESRDRLRARFYREARAAAALPHHPNVVPVYDYGSDPTLKLDYIVMELLRGRDLASTLGRSGPPPLSAGLRILYEAARGVAVGHRSGLIHRDVKPGNIFLAETDQAEVQVRVVDFGIAKLADDEDSLAQLTQDGRVPHSPAFASPEQLRGLSTLTPASDVFSLGAVGFVLLTGERPFSESDRNRMALGMPVPPPSLREKNPALPSAVDAAVRKALAFDPDDRFADASEMAAALRGALREMPDAPIEPYAAGVIPRHVVPDDDDRTRVLPTPPGGDDHTRAMPGEEDDRTLLAPPPERSATGGPAPGRPSQPSARAFPRREPRRRSKAGLIVWTIVLLVLAAAVFAIWTEMGPRRQATTLADSIPPPPDSIPEITVETTVPETIDNSQPELQAYVLNDDGLRYFRAGNFEDAAENFRLATEFAPGNPEYAYNYGHALMRLGDLSQAAAQFERVTRLDTNRTGAYYQLGVARLTLGDTVGAWTALQRARELADTPVERAAALRQIRAIEAAQADLRPGAPTDTTSLPSTPPPVLDTVPRAQPTEPRDTLTGPRPGSG